MKRIVICLDGTGDFAAKNPTHVFRLYRALERGQDQLIYYNGGVGTLRDAAYLSPMAKSVFQDLDLAAGFSIRSVFIEAYSFLATNYEDGDEIFLFGFSRGAYTARALAGAIHYFGMFYPQQVNVVPYLWQDFAAIGDQTDKDSWRTLRRMGAAFGRPCSVKFLGAWDTVSSFGLIKLRTLPQTYKLRAVDTVRHAVSIDERRNMFPENLCDPTHPDMKEIWYAGVHRDVGGGGNADALALSMFPLNWIVQEAALAGLKILGNKRDELAEIKPDPCGKWNYSLFIVLVYALIGLAPMDWWLRSKGGYAWKWPNFRHIRELPEGAAVHDSVKTRMSCPTLHYHPRNLKPGHFTFVQPGSDRPVVEPPNTNYVELAEQASRPPSARKSTEEIDADIKSSQD